MPAAASASCFDPQVGGAAVACKTVATQDDSTAASPADLMPTLAAVVRIANTKIDGRVMKQALQ
jgi:hypothetical protein